jgi:hypothetical protein
LSAPSVRLFVQPRAFLLLFAAILLPAGVAAAAPKPAKLQYNRDIRPVLSDNCFLCHGPDKNTRKGKLRLDLREEALARKAIVPGRPAESSLVARLFTADRDEVMPPPDSHKSLTAGQRELLKRWVAEGAEYQPHWSYVKPQRSDVPAVRHRSWVANPIDAFVLAKLEAQRRRPSPEADRRTLLRRLALDLVGLPPTPEEVAAFVADRDPFAYEKQVDRLLASVHFGERMAAPWLDTVRFADTVGYHGDQNQRIFPYRDYVIRSLNQNKSFADFTVEQLAGDLLPQPTVEQRIATGFNRLNMVTREGGAQPKEYLAKYAADRVRTVSTTWLGSTMGCSECHDHKFDPFTMRDFYSLEACFADVQQWGVYSDYKYTPNPDLKGWSNDHPFPPELEVESDYLQRRLTRLRGLLREEWLSVYRRVAVSPGFADWIDAGRAFGRQHPDGWVALEPEVPEPAPDAPAAADPGVLSASVTNAPAKPEPGVIRLALANDKEPEKVVLRLEPGRIAALRMERLDGAIEEKLGPGEQSRGIRFSAVLRRQDRDTKIAWYRADADHKEERYGNGEELLGTLAGWKPARALADQVQTSVWLPEPPIQAQSDDVLVLAIQAPGKLALRFSASPFAAADPLAAGLPEAFRTALDATPAERTEPQQLVLTERYLLSTQVDAAALARCQKLEREILQCRNGRTRTLVTVAWQPPVTRVLPRGNWQDESGAIVQPRPPRFLTASVANASIGSSDSDADRPWSRLELARWLVSREQPLTARVFVNRLWKQFFGAGLCATVDDLGSQGDWPVHAALLDWLAVEFMEPSLATRGLAWVDAGHAAADRVGPWDIKHMVRLLVTSATYRQSSNQRADLLAVDPQNRWLWAQMPRRLEAEIVRDNALAAAGLLNLEVGGPSAQPYQPGGYYEALQFPDREYTPQTDERQYRRGLYMHWQRTFLHPMLANFDAPSREECTAARNVSNTPQQALTLLNDPSFVEAARVLATRLLQAGVGPGAGPAADRARLEELFLRALARPPNGKEVASLSEFLRRQRAHYAGEPDEARALVHVGFAPVPAAVAEAELASWTEVCRVVLNTHESITRY